MVTEDIWKSVAVPLLERIYEAHQAQQLDLLTVGELADALNLDPNIAASQLDSLHDGRYLVGEVHKTSTGGDPRPWILTSTRLGERGLREVRAWPSDGPYEALLDILDRMIATTDEPERKTRYQAFHDAAADIGKTVMSGLLVELAKGTIRF